MWADLPTTGSFPRVGPRLLLSRVQVSSSTRHRRQSAHPFGRVPQGGLVRRQWMGWRPCLQELTR